jgi:hypothetical protein
MKKPGHYLVGLFCLRSKFSNLTNVKWSLICLALFFKGCSPVYIPNLRNATLFENKGEIKATAYAWRSVNAQVAYALTNHVAVTANGAMSLASDIPRHQYGELGAGYFTKLTHFNLEFFGGYGFGTTSSYFNQLLVGDYYKIYTTQAIGQRDGKIEWSFINRLSLVDFVTYPTDPKRRATFYLEPAGYMGYSLINERLFVAAQFGICYPLRSASEFDYEPFSMAIGLTYRFGRRMP